MYKLGWAPPYMDAKNNQRDDAVIPIERRNPENYHIAPPDFDSAAAQGEFQIDCTANQNSV